MSKVELTDIQPQKTVEEYIKEIDPDGLLSEDMHKELFKVAELTHGSQQLFSDCGVLVGLLIEKMNQIEDRNADALEAVQVFYSMLTAPEDKH